LVRTVYLPGSRTTRFAAKKNFMDHTPSPTSGAPSFSAPSRRSFVPAAIAGCLLLTALSVYFRCQNLENIPGFNGDEAWYGVQAVQLLRGGGFDANTPTGNLLNPFFLGPLVLLHAVFPPSFALLRSVAVAGGIAALLLNWFLCRKIFDRPTAWISTTLLAILPINIAYSRFAWDASQSVAATLPVWYCALAAIRFPQRFRQWMVAALLAQIVAFLVHPTNIFTVAVLVTAAVFHQRGAKFRESLERLRENRRWRIGILAAGILLAGGIFWLSRTPLPRALWRRITGVHKLELPEGTPPLSVLYPRLFTGGTIYRYLAGSHSWFEWPLAEEGEGFELDVAAFWIVLAAAAAILLCTGTNERRPEQRALVAAWALTCAGFWLLAGSRALIPELERYALCLIAPIVLMFSRAAALAFTRDTYAARIATLLALVFGGAMLADFHTHYFRFIEQTGGRAHRTFRTGPVEPKAAALAYIQDHRPRRETTAPGKTRIITSQWWLLYPLRYLAAGDDTLVVLGDKEAEQQSVAIGQGARHGTVWYVEFSRSPPLKKRMAEWSSAEVERHEIKDFSNRPIITLLHPLPKSP